MTKASLVTLSAAMLNRTLRDPAGDQQLPSGEHLSESANPQTLTFPALRGSLNSDKSWAGTLQALPFAYWEMQRRPKSVFH